MFGKRILILVPHPDDEVVACAAAMARARAEGASVAAMYLTDGCLSERTLWPWQRKKHKNFVARRRAEAEEVARVGGITPLRWSDRPARYLWQEMPKVVDEIQEACASYKPDQVWVPAYEGGNPDHDALNAIGSKLAGQRSVLEFSEYNFFEGKANAQKFIKPNNATQEITLSAEEKATKKKLLKIYASERSNLSYVGTDRETFRPLAGYDYTQPPHDGVLWYARFQWVPFLHPRVDFTLPSDVSKAIATFLSTEPTIRQNDYARPNAGAP